MIVWLNPATGLSGDMLLGALLDLDAPLEQVRAAVAATGLTGWRLDAHRVTVDGLTATRAVIEVDDHVEERRAAELLDHVRNAVPEPVAAMASRAVAAIAEVEGALHGCDPEEVHLHELGGLDTVVDTVAVAAALQTLGITALHCGPVALGTGQVSTRHGIVPAPAPATMALLAGVPVRGIEVTGETVTPTGAALLRAAAAEFGPIPPMRVARTGYGAGTKSFPGRPNVLQAVAGEPLHVAGYAATVRPSAAADRAGDGPPEAEEQELILLETNLDDVTGEQMGHLIQRALATGAMDAWVSPAVMKKGRPAHVAHLLCRPGDVSAFQEMLFAETGTLGIRHQRLTRVAVPRSFTCVTIEGHEIRIKHGPYGSKPEHDDVAAAAAALNVPVPVVLRAMAAAQADAPRTRQPARSENEARRASGQ